MKNTIDLAGKRVLVVGLARTGIATALFCAERGARVTVSESRTEAEIPEAVAKIRAAGCTLELGGHRAESFLAQDLIVPSPGVPAHSSFLLAAREAKIPVWSEIEFAWRFLRGKLIAITGSNGKTTTTALIGHIVAGARIPTIVAGNIGTPLISRVMETSSQTVTVLEASSFQLELIDKFRPDVALLLNITPDHLDRHPSLEHYAQAKARIFLNQVAAAAAVINADDPAAVQYAPSIPQVFWFSRAKRVASGVFLRDDQVVFRRDGSETVLLRRSDIGLRGEHNVENVMAAAGAAFLVGVDPKSIAEGVRSFAGVEHRIEFVAEINGVNYYNDSKATNVDATLKALDAFPRNLIVILGGKDKGSDYTLLRDLLSRRAKLALLIGAATEKIAAQIAGAVAIEKVETIERAVTRASQLAQPGDTVLLAPACASFDQFQNYEHRGRVFKQRVRLLEEEIAAGGRARAS
ncbi:MAG TPA: UDP-N-acetylmuramoyl-L-alanine--D-glutamate ligase [Candidatus Acidoferrales bacterium]|nr:UDP-N-acetylmuramoyl-L-alanine--D-glutamate ligase [Candidatus Acidoferrales bacterium]